MGFMKSPRTKPARMKGGQLDDSARRKTERRRTEYELDYGRCPAVRHIETSPLGCRKMGLAIAEPSEE